MGGMSCANPNSCHPLLLTFGLITIFLMAFYLIRDTLFDNARSKKGPILSTFNTAKPRQPPVSAAPVSISGAGKFAGNLRGLERGNGEESSKGSVTPIFEIKKTSQSPNREEADLGRGPAAFAEESPKYEDKWHGNIKHVQNGHGRKRSQGPKISRFSSEESRALDLEYRPASFVGEGPDGFQAVEFNPYTWHVDVKGLDKEKSEGMASEKV